MKSKLVVIWLLSLLMSATLFAQRNINLVINDKAIVTSIALAMDSSGTVLVPISEITDPLGIKFSYDAKKKLVTLAKGETQVKFVLNSKKIYVNDKEKDVLATGKLIGNSIMVSSSIMKHLGLYVGWDLPNNRVIINNPLSANSTGSNTNNSLTDNQNAKALEYKIYTLLKKKDISENDLINLVDQNKLTIKEIYDSQNNKICVLANKFSKTYDSDQDGLSDYNEIFKYKTDPLNKDSDGDGIIDSDWNERREHTYTLVFKTRIFNVYDESSMTTGFQDYKIINKTNEYTDFEIVTYPENTYYTKLYSNPNWKADYAGMQEYLKPNVLCNWDEKMREDLINELKKSNINPDTLTDVELVRKVTSWIENNNKRLSTNGWDIFLETDGNKVIAPTRPRVVEKMREAFPSQTFDEIRDSTILGKEMFYNKTIGECTSSSTYYATILRALGVPTRIVIMTPMANGTASRQLKRLDQVKRTNLRAAIYKNWNVKGWGNHYHTQVFIGNTWVDVEYANVGYNFASEIFLGGITFNTVIDFSQFAKLANEVWSPHMHLKRNMNFTNWIPYDLLDVKDYEPLKLLDKQ